MMDGGNVNEHDCIRTKEITELQVHMDDLIGGEQRGGRITRLEDDVKSVTKFIYMALGILAFLQVAAANGWLKIVKP